MLECRNCLLSCLRAVVGEARPGLSAQLLARTSPHVRRRINHPLRSLRNHSTETRTGDRGFVHYSPGNPDHRHAWAQESSARNGPITDKDASEIFEEWENPRPERTYSKDSSYMGINRMRKIDPRGRSILPTVSKSTERSLRTELTYLQDPLKLATHVKYRLARGEAGDMINMVRLASKDMDCVVSWNHIIGHLLAKKQFSGAFKLYNEMKKRAQFPDTYTYAILLRGLAEPPVHKDILRHALSIYHSLDAPNSRVKATVIHTNAALKVCSAANDMDSLWGIAAKIPEFGPGAADKYTYSTILHALQRHALLESSATKDEVEVTRIREMALEHGRRIWGDVIFRWRAGDIDVNEAMVCSIGRLLLTGIRPRDWDDVLSLIEQTMEIPRLIPRMGTKMRNQEHIPPSVMFKEKSMDAEGEAPKTEFDRELVVGSSGKGPIAFVKPGNSSLSMILEACQKMYAWKAASEYWDLLTDPMTFAIRPDLDNLHSYMRILRLARASGRSVELIEKTFFALRFKPERKTLRIAMSTCVRDKNNRNVMEHANKLIELGDHYKIEPDPLMLMQYLDLALTTEDGKAIGNAITNMSEAVTRLKSSITFGNVDSVKTFFHDKQDVLKLTRTIVGAIDHMLSKNMIPAEERAVWSQRRTRLAAWVTRLMNKMNGNPSITPDKVLELRRESRQLRNLRRNNVKREKKADGTWVDDHVLKKQREDGQAPREDSQKSKPDLEDLPF